MKSRVFIWSERLLGLITDKIIAISKSQREELVNKYRIAQNDKFETINSLPLDQHLDQQWAQIFQMGRECFMDIDYDENDRPILPSLSDIIKSYSDAKAMHPTPNPTTPIEFDTSNNYVFNPQKPTSRSHNCSTYS